MKRESIRIAVIQLARLGDTIQSLMALRAAQQLYPELEITFIAHESFAGAAERCPWISRVISLPTEDLIRPLLNRKKSAHALIPDVAGWVEPILNQTFDLVVNWTFSEASSYLAGILPARVRLGYSRRRDGTLSVVDGWSHYIHSVVQTETTQSIHLTDILTTQLLTALQIHFEDPIEENANQCVTSKSFFNIQKSSYICDGWNHPGIRWIAIQLGASSSDKTWSPNEWAKLASSILRRHDETRIIILGGEKEKENEAEFLKAFKAEEKSTGSTSRFEKRLISKIGTTNFDHWAQILSESQWVISADTAAIHLASVLGTRVFNLSIGPVRFRETGPYGNGHYVIRAGLDPSSLSAEAVYAAWTYASTEWQHRLELSAEEHFKNLGQSTLTSITEFYRSKIRLSENGGGIHYESLIGSGLSMENWFSQVLGHLAREWYCGWVPPVGQEIDRAQVTPELIQSLRKLSEGIDVLDKIFNETIRSAEELVKKTKSLKSDKLMKISDREKINELGLKLQELDELSARVGNTQETLLPIHRLAQILMHNLTSKRIADVAEETVGVYRFLKIGMAVLRKWTDHTLSLARPVAIQSNAPVISLTEKRDQRSPSA